MASIGKLKADHRLLKSGRSAKKLATALGPSQDLCVLVIKKKTMKRKNLRNQTKFYKAVFKECAAFYTLLL